MKKKQSKQKSKYEENLSILLRDMQILKKKQKILLKQSTF